MREAKFHWQHEFRRISVIEIFKKDHNCWATPSVDRFSLLIDGANYYGALRNALLKAEKTIFIVGWDVDSRVRLMGEEPPDDGAPEHLKELLEYLVQEKPDLRIHVLLWDFSVLYALERDPMPVLNLSWATPPRVEVCLDDIVPLGASHHQKIVIIDGAVAFCGGLDLAIRRWDTREHDPENEHRVEPNGTPYIPFHDIQCVLDGEAAARLTELVVNRWEEAACKTPDVSKAEGDPWPDGVEPLFENHQVAIARTVPALGDRAPVHEVEQLFIDMISAAENTIYLENQFFTSVSVAEALASRLSEKQDLEAILVSSMEPHGFLEEHSMATGMHQFMEQLEDAEVMDRVRLVYPRIPDGSERGQDVLVHAKLSIIDDTILRVGSANVNNRSMGTDGECDLALQGVDESSRAKIRQVHYDLLGEHLGLSVDDVAAEIEAAGSVRAVIDKRTDEPRTLVLIDYQTDVDKRVSKVVQAVADPERPGEVSRFAGDMLSARPAGMPIRGRYLALGGVALVVLLISVWQFSPLAELTDPAELKSLMAGLQGNPWAYVLVPLGFVVGSALVFPITAMIAATAIVFPPVQAFLLALAGSLLGASVNYALGSTVGKRSLRRVMGKRLNKISRALAEQGILTVVTLRVVPVAPFTLINLVAGASHIRFYSFVVGTVLGMVPAIATMTLVGDQINNLIENPTMEQVLALGGAVVLWIGVAVGAKYAIRAVTRWVRDRRQQ